MMMDAYVKYVMENLPITGKRIVKNIYEVILNFNSTKNPKINN